MTTDSETAHARKLSGKILDRPGADPGDGLAVLARQFLRAEEKAARRDVEITALQKRIAELDAARIRAADEYFAKRFAP